MQIRKLLPVLAASIILVAGMSMTGCDELITETINNTITDSSLAIGCFNCHSDDDNILLRPKGQWANSKHASGRLVDSASACGPECHSHEGYISTFDGAAIAVGQYSAIGCFTCHAPHNQNYVTLTDSSDQLLSQLRGADPGLLVLENGSTYIIQSEDQSRMCINCHRADFDISTPTDSAAGPVNLPAGWGPHFGGQADMFNASGGYWFAGATAATGRKHAIAAQGTRDGCLNCHYGKGDGYNFGEHTFRLENESSGAQFVANCNTSQCHLSGANGGTIVDLFTRPKTVNSDSIAGELGTLLTSMNVFDSTGIFRTDTSFSPDVARSLYNYLFYIQEGSHGIHNPDYADSLLLQSIRYLPVTAYFDAGTIRADSCDSLELLFVNRSKGPIDSLVWRFPDTSFVDTLLTDSTFSRFYTTRETFSLDLIAYGPAATNIDTMTDTVTIALPDSLLSAGNFTWVQDTVDLLQYQFSDSSFGATSWVWDFGVDTSIVDTSTLQNPNFTFPAASTYNVMLIVTNDCGDVDTTTQNLNLSGNRFGSQAHLEPGRTE